MKTPFVLALLLCATTLVALAPLASAVICTIDPTPIHVCVPGGDCVVGGDVQPCDEGVCVNGERVLGPQCTVDLPAYTRVCFGDYDPLYSEDIAWTFPERCANTRGTVWWDSCGGDAYALRVFGAQHPCMRLP